jgi:ABC-type transporter Mla subunit MlaD
MARGAFLLVLVVVGFVVWAAKAATGRASGTANDQIRHTIRRTSSWMDGLKQEWDRGKNRPGGS